MIHSILHYFESGNGYQFWSGIGSDIGEITLFAGMVALYRRWRQHNTCHVEGCTSLGHKHPGHGFPVCRNHYHHPLNTGSARL